MSDSEQKFVFQTNLNRLLQQRGKSQREVAEAIGVSPQTFNTWCQGIALPRMGKIQLLADYFGILKSQLVDEQPNASDALLLSPVEREIILKYRVLSDDAKDMLLRSLGIEGKKESEESCAG